MKRGRRPASFDTKKEIIEAARLEFAELGFEQASLRRIARRAGVDSALIHHYFSGKLEIFEESLKAGEAERFAEQAKKLFDETAPENWGAEIVRSFLRQLDDPLPRESFSALAKSSLSLEAATESARGYLGRHVLAERIRQLDPSGQNPDLRASMITSILYGLGLGRVVTNLPVMVAASQDELVALVGPLIQACLEGTAAASGPSDPVVSKQKPDLTMGVEAKRPRTRELHDSSR